MLGERIADLGPARREPGFGDHVSVKEAVLPFDRFDGRRRAAGPGDALDRRGDGHRARLPDGVRQGAGRGRRAAAAAGHRRSSRSPTPTRPARRRHRRAAARHRLPDRRDARHGRGDRAHGRPGASGSTRSARARRTWSTGSSAATSTSSINTPTGSGARTDGYEIRRAAVAHGIPCMTTLSGGHGGGARDRAPRARGEAAVLSLQELHAARATSAPRCVTRRARRRSAAGC